MLQAAMKITSLVSVTTSLARLSGVRNLYLLLLSALYIDEAIRVRKLISELLLQTGKFSPDEDGAEVLCGIQG